MVLSAYTAKATTAGGPIQRFGEPNEWLNIPNFIEFHEETIVAAKATGIIFLDAAVAAGILVPPAAPNTTQA